MLREKILFVLLMLYCFCLPINALAQPDPTEQMKPFLAKLVDVLNDEDCRKELETQICTKLVEVSKEKFDYYEMSKRVVGKKWRELSQAEKDKFVEKFTTLLQHTYSSKIKEYSGEPVRFVGQRVKGKRAEVKTELLNKGQLIHVSYIMLLKDNNWMVYDVVVEGVSLIRNYMEQFRPLVRKYPFDEVLAKIDDKIKEIEKEQQGK